MVAGAVVAVATLVGSIEGLGLGAISTEVLVLATLGDEAFCSMVTVAVVAPSRATPPETACG